MLIVDDYNGNPEPGKMQKPIISMREASRLKREYDNFWFYYWLMQPYAITHQVMDFPEESKQEHLSWEELRRKWQAMHSCTSTAVEDFDPDRHK